MYLLLLAALTLLSRWIVHIPNFTAVLAFALIVGKTMKHRQWAVVLIPVGMMAISDLLLGWHYQAPLVYSLVGGLAYLASRVRLEGFVTWGLGGLGASTGFFLISNFGVWVAGGLYPRTLGGLLECYVMAVPFFQATVMSTLFFSGLFLLIGFALRNTRYSVPLRVER